MDNTAISEKELSIKFVITKTVGFLRFILRHRLLISIFLFLGVILGILNAWLKPIEYQAVLTFTAEEEKSSSGGIANIAAQFGLSVSGGGTVFSGDNLLSLITSKRIITNVLLRPVLINNKKTNLLTNYINIYSQKAFSTDTLLKHVNFPLQQDPSTFTRLQDSVLQNICLSIIKKNISVTKPDKRLDIFEIDCTSKDENFSITLSKQIITEVSAFYIETKTKRLQTTVIILQNKADSIKKEYVESLSGRAALLDANVNPAFQQPIVSIQRKQTDITVLTSEYGEIVKNLEIAKFNLLENTPLIQTIDEPMLPLTKIKQSRLLTGLLWGILFGFGGILIAYFRSALKEANNK